MKLCNRAARENNCIAECLYLVWIYLKYKEIKAIIVIFIFYYHRHNLEMVVLSFYLSLEQTVFWPFQGGSGILSLVLYIRHNLIQESRLSIQFPLLQIIYMVHMQSSKHLLLSLGHDILQTHDYRMHCMSSIERVCNFCHSQTHPFGHLNLMGLKNFDRCLWGK